MILLAKPIPPTLVDKKTSTDQGSYKSQTRNGHEGPAFYTRVRSLGGIFEGGHRRNDAPSTLQLALPHPL